MKKVKGKVGELSQIVFETKKVDFTPQLVNEIKSRVLEIINFYNQKEYNNIESAFRDAKRLSKLFKNIYLYQVIQSIEDEEYNIHFLDDCKIFIGREDVFNLPYDGEYFDCYPVSLVDHDDIKVPYFIPSKLLEYISKNVSNILNRRIISERVGYYICYGVTIHTYKELIEHLKFILNINKATQTI